MQVKDTIFLRLDELLEKYIIHLNNYFLTLTQSFLIDSHNTTLLLREPFLEYNVVYIFIHSFSKYLSVCNRPGTVWFSGDIAVNKMGTD